MEGAGAEVLFKDEAGGHRWQHVPKNEKRGRVHTSTVTVAVLQEPPVTEILLRDGDLEWGYCRGSGKGGQHRNVTDSAVQLTHLPSKLMVRCESERSQKQNKQTALVLLRAKLWEHQHAAEMGARAADRKQQVGCGERSDKTWTIAVQRGIVIHHASGKRFRYSDYVRGDYQG